jgi:hypothetical protein
LDDKPLKAIIGNVPSLVTAMGATPELAAAISLVAVALAQLEVNWGRLFPPEPSS